MWPFDRNVYNPPVTSRRPVGMTNSKLFRLLESGEKTTLTAAGKSYTGFVRGLQPESGRTNIKHWLVNFELLEGGHKELYQKAA